MLMCCLELQAKQAATDTVSLQYLEVAGGMTSLARIGGLDPGRQYTVGVQAFSPHGRSHFTSRAVLTWPGQCRVVFCELCSVCCLSRFSAMLILRSPYRHRSRHRAAHQLSGACGRQRGGGGWNGWCRRCGRGRAGWRCYLETAPLHAPASFADGRRASAPQPLHHHLLCPSTSSCCCCCGC